MAKAEQPLQIDIPKPADDRPVWSRVGVVAAVGFAIGLLWPRLAGVTVGPNAPADMKPAQSAGASANPTQEIITPPPASSASAAVSATGSASAAPAGGTVTVGPGKIQRCADKKGKKQESCGELMFDPVVTPRLKNLAKCPNAIGLDGQVNLGFEVHFEKKELHVVRGKKNKLPGSTVQGILQCAVKEMASVVLDEVPHKHARYTLSYTITFSKSGAAEPEPGGEKGEKGGKGEKGDDDEAVGATTNETQATGSATVAWDTALLRKEPKDGEVIARLVRGTRVKLLGRQNDWYKVESGSKTGWVYRGSIGQ